MKTLIASIFAVALLGTTAASADVGIGAHVGGLGAGLNVGVHDHDHYYRHHRHCVRWSRHHPGVCREWGW